VLLLYKLFVCLFVRLLTFFYTLFRPYFCLSLYFLLHLFIYFLTSLLPDLSI